MKKDILNFLFLFFGLIFFSLPLKSIDFETQSSGTATPIGPAGNDLSGNYPNPSITEGAVDGDELADTINLDAPLSILGDSVLIGTTTADAKLKILQTSLTEPAIKIIVNEAGANAIEIEKDGAGASLIINELWSSADSRNAPAVNYKRNRGTRASNLPVLSGDRLGEFRFWGSYEAGTETSRQLDFGAEAAEDWNLTDRGTRFFVRGTDLGSTVRRDWISINDGHVGISTGTPKAELHLVGRHVVEGSPETVVLPTVGVTITKKVMHVRGNNAGNNPITATPNILNCIDDEEIQLIGTDDVNRIEFQDDDNLVGSGLKLYADTNFILGRGDVLIIRCDSLLGVGIELDRSDN